MSASTKKKLRKEENAVKLTEKQLAEQKEAKKLKGYTMTFVILVCLVLVAAVAIMGVTAFNNSGILQRNTDAVTVGEHTLNNAELNYFYLDQVNQFYSTWKQQYGDYTDMYLGLMGIDATKPLNTLPYAGGEEGYTYADYFKDLAIAQASSTYAIYDLAVKEGQLREQLRHDGDVCRSVWLQRIRGLPEGHLRPRRIRRNLPPAHGYAGHGRFLPDCLL